MDVEIDDQYIHELLSLDPAEWLNIPAPLISAIHLIRTTLNAQHQLFKSLENHIRLVDDKIDTKAANIRESISQLTNSMDNIEGNAQIKNDLLEEKLSSKQLKLKGELLHEIDDRISLLRKQTSGIKNQIMIVNDTIDKLPRNSDVTEEIMQSEEQLRVKLLSEIENFYVKPEIDILTKKINVVSEEVRSDTTRWIELLEVNVNQLKKSVNAKVTDAFHEANDNANKHIKEVSSKIDNSNRRIQQLDYESEALNKDNIEKLQEINQKIEKTQRILKEKFKHFQSFMASTQSTVFEQKLRTDKLYLDLSHMKTAKQENTKPQEEEHDDIPSKPKEPELKESEPSHPAATTNYSPPIRHSSTLSSDLPPRSFDTGLTDIYSEIDTKFSKTKSEINESLTHQFHQFREEILRYIDESFVPIKNDAVSTHRYVESNIAELREKLIWLPINLSSLDGMKPTEARLFTLEARLRSEENIRLQLQRELRKVIEHMQNLQEPVDIKRHAYIPQINSGTSPREFRVREQRVKINSKRKGSIINHSTRQDDRVSELPAADKVRRPTFSFCCDLIN